MPRHAVARLDMPHAVACCMPWYYGMSWDVGACHAMACREMQWHARACHHGMPWHVMQWHVVACHAMPSCIRCHFGSSLLGIIRRRPASTRRQGEQTLCRHAPWAPQPSCAPRYHADLHQASKGQALPHWYWADRQDRWHQEFHWRSRRCCGARSPSEVQGGHWKHLDIFGWWWAHGGVLRHPEWRRDCLANPSSRPRPHRLNPLSRRLAPSWLTDCPCACVRQGKKNETRHIS